ncbi:MAG: nucleoside deaminase [Candidatus Acidiferrales bacterium]
MDSTLDAHSMLAVALEQARIGLAEGGIPVGGAIFRADGTLLGAGRNRLVQNGDPSMHGETDAFRAAGRQPSYRDLILVTTLTPCWYCTGLIYQFRFKQVIVGDSVNAQGGADWLRQQGRDILDLASPECIEMMGKFKRMNPQLWNECVGEG